MRRFLLPIVLCVVLCLYASTPAFAQVAVLDAAASNTPGAAPPGDPYTAFTYAVSAGSNRLLVLFVGVGNGGGNPRFINVTPTYGGQTATGRIGTGTGDDGNFVGVDGYYWNEAAIAAAASTTFSIDTTPGEQIDQLGVGAISLSGVSQATPISGATAANGTTVTGTPFGVTVSSAANDMVLAAVMTDDEGAGAGEVDPNQTLMYKIGNIGTDTAHAAQRAAGAASVTATWTTTAAGGNGWAALGINVKATGGGAASTECRNLALLGVGAACSH